MTVSDCLGLWACSRFAVNSAAPLTLLALQSCPPQHPDPSTSRHGWVSQPSPVKLATKLAALQLSSAFLFAATAVILYLIIFAVDAEQLALLHIYRAPDGNNCSATTKLFEHFRRRRKS